MLACVYISGWAGLLSRKNLQKASSQMRDMCNMCSMVNISDTPCILSACLVSLEVHESIHIMTEMIKEEDKASSTVPLTTPRDSSSTHILVVPTSTSAQVCILNICRKFGVVSLPTYWLCN
jgi:mediator of RNA polymerase II transcription subunit 13